MTRNTIVSLALATAILGVGLQLSGCVPPSPPYVPPPLPTSQWNGQYTYSFAAPVTSSRNYNVNIAVADPDYLKVNDVDTVFTNQLYGPVGKGFAASMGSDMDKLLIAKGMTATGPYDSENDMTYEERKQSVLTLAPQVFITIKMQYGPWSIIQDGQTVDAYGNTVQYRDERSFQMTTNGFVTFIMEEPLSEEKMWIKKLNLDPLTLHGVIDVEDGGGPDLNPTSTFLYDGRPDALADGLQQMYPEIMQKFWDYIDPNQIMALKLQVQEIRARSRFNSGPGD